MRFTDLNIQNFLIVKHAELSLANQGLVQILGENGDFATFDSNGSGKTTILEALVWALWGKTAAKLTADEVVNDHFGKNCRVSVTIENGDVIQVVRHRLHEEHRNELHLFVNGRTVTQGVTSQTQEYIDDLIGIDYTTFLNSVAFSQGTVKRFTSMTDREQKEALERILSMDWVTGLHQKVLDKQRQLSQDRSNCYAALQRISTEIEDAKQKKDLYWFRQQCFEEDQQQRTQDLKDERTAIRAKMRALKKGMGAKKGEIADAEKALKAVLDRRKSIESERDKTLDKWERKRREAKLFIKSFKRDVKEHQDDIDVLVDQGEGDCVTCGQPVTDKHIEAQIDSINHTIKSVKARIKAQDKRALNAESGQRETKEIADKLLDELAPDLAQVRENIVAVRDEQSAIHAAQGRIQGYSDRIDQIKAELSRVKSKTNHFAELFSGVEKQLKNLKKKLVIEKARRAKVKQEYEVLKFWEDGFSTRGIRSLLLDGVVDTLNERANFYSDMLTDGAIRIQFSTQKELKSGELRDLFHIDVVNESGASRYGANSAGEKRRIDLCVSLALGDLLASRSSHQINFMFLDEVFEALDESGVDAVMQLLEYLQESRESIFVITHLEGLRSYFPNKIHVVRKNNTATLRSHNGRRINH